MVIGDFNDMKESMLPFFPRFSTISDCEEDVSSAGCVFARAVELVEVWDIGHAARHNSKHTRSSM